MNAKSEARKWRQAQRKAHQTEKNALTFTKCRLNKLGWRYVDFQSKKGYPRTGIIDLVAVKLDKKDEEGLRLNLVGSRFCEEGFEDQFGEAVADEHSCEESDHCGYDKRGVDCE